MMFDAYHKWLGIPKGQRPPTHYQLLGLQQDEHDPEVIEEAAIRQSAHIRAYQVGQHAADCTRILNELANARTILLNPAKRREYDAKLTRSRKNSSSDAVTATAPNPDLDFSESPSTTRPAKRSANRPNKSQRLPVPLLVGIGGGAVVVLALVAIVLVNVFTSRPARNPIAEGKRPDIKNEPKLPKKDHNPFEIPDPKPIEKKAVAENPPITPTDPTSEFLSAFVPTELKSHGNWFERNGTVGGGRKMVVNNKESPHGLFIHPPSNSFGQITYDLGGKWDMLRGEVAINNTDKHKTPATPFTFVIVGDRNVLWKSQPVDRYETTQPFEVSVTGVRVLELQVECPGNHINGYAVWLEPKLSRAEPKKAS